LKQSLSRRKSTRLGAAVAVAAGVTALAVAISPALAAAAASASETTGPTVFIRDGKGGLRFVAPKTIVEGESLTVLNQTNAKKVGPHTFSLVTKESIPKTRKEQEVCFTKGHICKAIAGWHGVKGEGPPSKNPAEAGAEGWSTMGSLTEKGDSWFTGNKPGATITQMVSAGATAGPTTIYFICAIHPWMHGKITVLPVG
jgi:hypothetical protein